MPVDLLISEKRKRQCAKFVDLTKEAMREAFDRFKPEEIGLTWTGGKDSGLALWVTKQVCAERKIAIPRTLVIGEGDEFPEIESFIAKYAKEWKVPIEICRNDDVLQQANHTLGATVHVKNLNARNQAELERIGFKDPSFPFEAESYTGNHLMKAVVFAMWVEKYNLKAVVQGLRWDEHPARFEDKYFEDAPSGPMLPPHVRIRPILHFTEKDLWDTYAAFKIPHCVLYEQGYRSLGAATTSKKFSDVPAWRQDLENTEERAGRQQDKEKAMERLRKLGYM